MGQMKHKINHDSYVTEPANIVTVGAGADGEPKFERTKMSNDAKARTAALKEWDKTAAVGQVGYEEYLPFHLGYLWRCVECFEGICFAHDFPTVKLTTADDLGPCTRCGCDLNAGGAWMGLSQATEKGERDTILRVVTSAALARSERKRSHDDDDDLPF